MSLFPILAGYLR